MGAESSWLKVTGQARGELKTQQLLISQLHFSPCYWQLQESFDFPKSRAGNGTHTSPRWSAAARHHGTIERCGTSSFRDLEPSYNPMALSNKCNLFRLSFLIHKMGTVLISECRFKEPNSTVRSKCKLPH